MKYLKEEELYDRDKKPDNNDDDEPLHPNSMPTKLKVRIIFLTF